MLESKSKPRGGEWGYDAFEHGQALAYEEAASRLYHLLDTL